MVGEASSTTTNRQKMKIQLLPNTPMTPLNSLFPDGVPVTTDAPVTEGVNDQEDAMWILDLTSLEKPTLDALAKLINSDSMPLSLTFTVINTGVFLISNTWVVEVSADELHNPSADPLPTDQ